MGQGRNNADDKATTLRLKHSATEQRRRSKINDRFQMLGDLIPHSDQKRDKASLLLEAIEYIQFLHEKVQKYETDCHGWNQDDTKLMPWVKVLFRSFWKNARKSSGGFGNTMDLNDTSNVQKNVLVSPTFVLPGDDLVTATPVSLTSDQTETLSTHENASSALVTQESQDASICAAPHSLTCVPGCSHGHQRSSTDPKTVESQCEAQWLGSVNASATDLSTGHGLVIDEGTMSISDAYSQWLSSSLSQALQKAGVDLSQANMSVQVNLGKRVYRMKETDGMDLEDPLLANQVIGVSRVESSSEVPEESGKRQKLDECP